VKIIRNKKVAVFGCFAGLVIFAAVGVFLLHISGSNRGGVSGQTSYAKNAWKFGDLVRSGVLYPVIRDIDGDTIVVSVEGQEVTVRLIGADTPETVDPRKPVQCYGPEASVEAKRIFGTKGGASGTASTTGIFVYLDKDPLKGDYDKYGRLLAYVRLPEDIVSSDGVNSGTDVYNEYMIKQGFAREYTYFNQPYKYQAEFKADEVAAKKADIGLWGKCGAG
jgi:micrococcal nuclease